MKVPNPQVTITELVKEYNLSNPAIVSAITKLLPIEIYNINKIETIKQSISLLESTLKLEVDTNEKQNEQI